MSGPDGGHRREHTFTRGWSRRGITRVASLVLIGFPGPCVAFAQQRIASITINPSIDTTNAVTAAIVRTVVAYWQSPKPGGEPTPLWSAEEQGRGTFDWNAGLLYYVGASATILQVTPSDTTGRTFVIKTLFTLARPSAPSQQLAVQRLYATRTDSGWVLGGALPRLTANWTTQQVGQIRYHYSPAWRFDESRARDAARFVDSAAAFLGVSLPSPIDYYLTESTDEMYRIQGLDWANQPSGPGTGRGGVAAGWDRTVFVGSAAAGEAYYHELAHVLLASTMPPGGRKGLVEEGAATWLGGSRGRGYDELLPILVRIQIEHPDLPFLRVGELSDEEREIAYYTTGALLVDAVFRAGGIGGVRRLLAAGRADAELYRVLGELLGLSQEGFDAWWRAEAPRRAAERPRSFWSHRGHGL